MRLPASLLVRQGWLAAAFLLVAVPGPGDELSLSTGLKENLDLPYDAGEALDDEDDPPEIVVFYGQVFEAYAFVFALDGSTSMRSDGSWARQLAEFEKSVSDLGSSTRFGVVIYSTEMEVFREQLIAASQEQKLAAINFVSQFDPRGGSCVAEGVNRARKMLKGLGDTETAVIVTGDGVPRNCMTERPVSGDESFLDVIAQTLPRDPRIRVHTVYVGKTRTEGGIRFFRLLAAAHGGEFRNCSVE